LEDSREMQRKQTIPKGNSLREVDVEHRDSAEVLSISPASKRRKNDMQEVGKSNKPTFCVLALLNRRIPNGTYGGVGGRGLITPSYPIL